MKTPVAAALAAVLLLSASSAFAHAGTPRAHHRQQRQQHRIEQGMRRGGLTPRETMRLERGHMRIGRAIARAKADGRITRSERAHIARLQNMESRRIWRQRHDGQRAT
jgi:uncharacterized membrane protein YebE (DUF533 family)